MFAGQVTSSVNTTGDSQQPHDPTTRMPKSFGGPLVPFEPSTANNNNTTTTTLTTAGDAVATANGSSSLSDSDTDDANMEKKDFMLLFLLQQHCKQQNDPALFYQLVTRMEKLGILSSSALKHDPLLLQHKHKDIIKEIISLWPTAQSGTSTSLASRMKRSGSLPSLQDIYAAQAAASMTKSFPVLDFVMYRNSRYKQDFHQTEPLGKGGFGSVFKAKHKIDNAEYAIKKIKFRFRSLHDLQKTYAKVVREVEALAKLDNKHVVRYHQAWFEPCRVRHRKVKSQPRVTDGKPQRKSRNDAAAAQTTVTSNTKQPRSTAPGTANGTSSPRRSRRSLALGLGQPLSAEDSSGSPLTPTTPSADHSEQPANPEPETSPKSNTVTTTTTPRTPGRSHSHSSDDHRSKSSWFSRSPSHSKTTASTATEDDDRGAAESDDSAAEDTGNLADDNTSNSSDSSASSGSGPRSAGFRLHHVPKRRTKAPVAASLPNTSSVPSTSPRFARANGRRELGKDRDTKQPMDVRSASFKPKSKYFIVASESSDLASENSDSENDSESSTDNDSDNAVSTNHQSKKSNLWNTEPSLPTSATQTTNQRSDTETPQHNNNTAGQSHISLLSASLSNQSLSECAEENASESIAAIESDDITKPDISITGSAHSIDSTLSMSFKPSSFMERFGAQRSNRFFPASGGGSVHSNSDFDEHYGASSGSGTRFGTGTSFSNHYDLSAPAAESPSLSSSVESINITMIEHARERERQAAFANTLSTIRLYQHNFAATPQSPNSSAAAAAALFDEYTATVGTSAMASSMNPLASTIGYARSAGIGTSQGSYSSSSSGSFSTRPQFHALYQHHKNNRQQTATTTTNHSAGSAPRGSRRSLEEFKMSVQSATTADAAAAAAANSSESMATSPSVSNSVSSTSSESHSTGRSPLFDGFRGMQMPIRDHHNHNASGGSGGGGGGRYLVETPPSLSSSLETGGGFSNYYASNSFLKPPRGFFSTSFGDRQQQQQQQQQQHTQQQRMRIVDEDDEDFGVEIGVEAGASEGEELGSRTVAHSAAVAANNNSAAASATDSTMKNGSGPRRRRTFETFEDDIFLFETHFDDSELGFTESPEPPIDASIGSVASQPQPQPPQQQTKRTAPIPIASVKANKQKPTDADDDDDAAANLQRAQSLQDMLHDLIPSSANHNNTTTESNGNRPMAAKVNNSTRSKEHNSSAIGPNDYHRQQQQQQQQHAVFTHALLRHYQQMSATAQSRSHSTRTNSDTDSLSDYSTDDEEEDDGEEDGTETTASTTTSTSTPTTNVKTATQNEHSNTNEKRRRQRRPRNDEADAADADADESGDSTVPEFQMTLYIQMQLCQPTSLEHWLWSPERIAHRTVDPATNLRYFRQILDGLAHIHQCGLIHRDLKPANLLIGFDGCLKIADFGLVTETPAAADNSTDPTANHIIVSDNPSTDSQPPQPQPVTYRTADSTTTTPHSNMYSQPNTPVPVLPNSDSDSDCSGVVANTSVSCGVHFSSVSESGSPIKNSHLMSSFPNDGQSAAAAAAATVDSPSPPKTLWKHMLHQSSARTTAPKATSLLDSDKAVVSPIDGSCALVPIADAHATTNGALVPLKPNHAPLTKGVGTPTYASPEQRSQRHYDAKSDIYSAGIILFEMFHPFATKTERVHILSQLRHRGVFPHDSLAAYPKEMEVVRRCLSQLPADRPTAAELLTNEIFSEAYIRSRYETPQSIDNTTTNQQPQQQPPPTPEIVPETTTNGGEESGDALRRALKDKDDEIEKLRREIERLAADNKRKDEQLRVLQQNTSS